MFAATTSARLHSSDRYLESGNVGRLIGVLDSGRLRCRD
jgi:hypothetical protein